MTQTRQLTVLFFAAGKGAATVTVEHTLEEMQKLVGGYLESLRLFDDDEVFVICNEEGKLNDLPPNRHIPGDVLVGDFFVVAGDITTGEFVELTPAQTSRVLTFMEGRSA